MAMGCQTCLTALLVLLLSGPAVAPADVEKFDLSGLSAHATTMPEQQIADLARAHQPGDVVGARVIQRKLAEFYTRVGDTPRARLALRRAGDTDAPAARTGARTIQAPADGAAPTPRVPATAGGAEFRAAGAFTASFYRMTGPGTMDTWDFLSDGTFVHTWIARGAGTNARSSERGHYVVDGGYVELRPAKPTTSYATPTPVGHGTDVGSVTEGALAARRVPFGLLGPDGRDGAVIDGETLKRKTS
jgi:hypothetical protein